MTEEINYKEKAKWLNQCLLNEVRLWKASTLDRDKTRRLKYAQRMELWIELIDENDKVLQEGK